MFAKRIIPCLDVTNGRVVKGTNFVNLKDAGDPVELAQEYNRQGADELVFLDITASSDKRNILIDLVKKTAEVVFIPFTVGGGIRDMATIRDILNAGADKVSINSEAIKNPDLIREASTHFGSQCIVVAIDAKKVRSLDNQDNPDSQDHQSAFPSHLDSKLRLTENSRWEVYVHGGRTPTGIDALQWAHYMADIGAGEILLTSMDQDGTKAGYDIELTDAVSQAVPIPVIASGGAGKTDHISDALSVCDAALLASLLHFKELTIADIKHHCTDRGIQIRFT